MDSSGVIDSLLFLVVAMFIGGVIVIVGMICLLAKSARNHRRGRQEPTSYDQSGNPIYYPLDSGSSSGSSHHHGHHHGGGFDSGGHHSGGGFDGGGFGGGDGGGGGHH